MKPVEYYRGREQTYLKHFFLERYLERVAYNIGSFKDEFVYVDGFSGPWKSEHEEFEDTSFLIAIQKLRQVREGLAKAGRNRRIRCLFIEKDSASFRALASAVKDVHDVEVTPLQGEFEQKIPEILRFVGNAFSLFFIDPTGWTGFGLKQIAPVLQHRGEVLVNFMFDYINRFLDHPNKETAATFDALFGGPGWEQVVRASGARREEAIVDFYCQRLRAAGGFEHVTSTRILKPTSDRAYFYLVYGTRHIKGLQEFRAVEKKAVEEQERVRLSAKQIDRVERSGQGELFAAATVAGPASFDQERAQQHGAAQTRLRALLQATPRVRYEKALAVLLEMPLVWESDVKSIVMDLRAGGELEVEGLKGGERTPKAGHVLILSRKVGPPV